MSASKGPADRRRQAREAQQRKAAADARRRTLRQFAIIGGVAVVVVAIVVSAVLLGRRDPGQGGAPTASTRITVDGASVPFAVDGSAVRLGPADAKARVDLWVDYSCPHCQEYEAANDAALDRLVAGGDVSVSYHNIQIVTDYGTRAGSAAACVAAGDPERWPAFNASLYANHSQETDGWTASRFRDFASQQGVTGGALDCIAADTYAGWISDNTAAAADQGVRGTPTMFLNSKPSELLTGQALVDQVTALAGR